MTNVTSYSNDSNGTTYTAPIEPIWVYWVPGPVICAFGVVCNILNLAVLSQKILKDSPYTYLTVLALSDLTLLAVSFIHLINSKGSLTYIKAFYDVYIFLLLGNICFNTSVWVIVCLTIERGMFVTRPMTFHSSRQTARIYCACIFVICAFINIPRYFCFKIVQVNENYFPAGTKFRESQTFYRISWAHALFINFIPILILLVTNSVLIHALHKATKERRALHSNQEQATRRDHIRLTRTLVAVVVVFFVCTFPSAFVEDPIAYSLFGGGKTWNEYLRSPANQLFIYISNLLVFLNSSLNFVLYCAFNQKFRQATKTLIKKMHPSCCEWKFEVFGGFHTDRSHATLSTRL